MGHAPIRSVEHRRVRAQHAPARAQGVVPREHMRALAAERRIGGAERLPALDVPRDGHEVHVIRVREEEREAVQLGEGERGQRCERAEVQLRDPPERERVCRRCVAVGERDAHEVHVALVRGVEQWRGGREDEVAEEGEEPLLDGAHLVHAREAAEREQVLERQWVAWGERAVEPERMSEHERAVEREWLLELGGFRAGGFVAMAVKNDQGHRKRIHGVGYSLVSIECIE